MSRNRNHVASPSKGLKPSDLVVLFVGTILALIPLIGLVLNLLALWDHALLRPSIAVAPAHSPLANCDRFKASCQGRGLIS
jgi:hypothetical protein